MSTFPKQRKKASRFLHSEDDAFVIVKVFVPKSTAAILHAKSESSELPISRLCAYAIDNELDVDAPFTYLCEQPKAPYVPYAYVSEASRMLAFLKRFKTGVTVETLMLCRREFEVESRVDVMLALRELQETNMVEEFEQRNLRFGVKQTRIRAVVDDAPVKLKPSAALKGR